MSEKDKPELNVIELSTGVKLRGKPMQPGVFINLAVANPPPDPPVYKTENGMYTNVDDPGYIEKMKHWKSVQSKDTLNGMIVFGTEFVSKPKDVPAIESDDWIDMLKTGGIKVDPNNKSWRYLWWVLTFAAPVAKDWEKIQEVVGRLSGVPENDVQSASSFPGS